MKWRNGNNFSTIKTCGMRRPGVTAGVWVMLCFLAAAHQLGAQAIVNFAYKTYGLEKDSDNVIQNATHLDDFFEYLYEIKAGGNRRVNIIHIGDSHIQADFLTNTVRRNLQTEFGNGGRGLIVPGRVAGTNEPFNIQTSSTVTWRSKRIININDPIPAGIGGITVSTDQPGARLYVYMNDLWMDYSFSTVTLFYQKDITSFHFLVKDTANNEVGVIGPFNTEPFVPYTKINLPYTMSAMQLETLKSAPEQMQGTIYGLDLENRSSKGIVYHAIGVNGAKYAHYNASPYFAKQTPALAPDLFIISLGTNEALDYPYLDKKFFQHVDQLITSLQESNPMAKFILVTPSDAFRKKIRTNPGIAAIRTQIIRYAVENGLAFWDMYRAAGGERSATAWRKAGLLRTDGIHFTRDGYDYQGNLLYYALMKSYNEYVSVRHP